MSTAFGSTPAAEILVELARGRGEASAGAGVDQHEAAAGVDHERREGDRQRLGRDEGVFEGLSNVLERGVLHETGVEGAAGEAVGQRRDLERADLVAIDARRLAAGRGRGGARARSRDGDRHGGAGGGQHGSARHDRHVVPSSVSATRSGGIGQATGERAAGVTLA
ncbi:hypothetical protein [Chenggangzhangella methanolivorans]|uniref:hypothetical protein n=1 Tax=Chenggangzhangella methanolivorans TaxID=1437009 RepID=UPI0021BD693E|nr:hypothetical protein [Chenggangzhangella methanolivorans]